MAAQYEHVGLTCGHSRELDVSKAMPAETFCPHCEWPRATERVISAAEAEGRRVWAESGSPR